MVRNMNIDMLSNLPDDLLLNIISFLPFKEATRTSILSRRWRHIWRATKKIELLESHFVDVNDSEENKQIKRKAFIDFANQWMGNNREPDINTFSLMFSRPGSYIFDMEHLIDFSILRNVKELSLDFHNPVWREDNLEYYSEVFDLPVNVYGHKGLESLKLFSCDFVLQKMKNFSALKQLSLGWTELKVCSIKTILAQCPLLEFQFEEMLPHGIP